MKQVNKFAFKCCQVEKELEFLIC